MAVLFWYLVKSDACVRCCTVAYTGQVTFYKKPDTHGHVQLVTLYDPDDKVKHSIQVDREAFGEADGGGEGTAAPHELREGGDHQTREVPHQQTWRLHEY